MLADIFDTGSIGFFVSWSSSGVAVTPISSKL